MKMLLQVKVGYEVELYHGTATVIDDVTVASAMVCHTWSLANRRAMLTLVITLTRDCSVR